MNEEKKCPYCENHILKSDNFCSNCGEPLNDIAKEILQKKDTYAQLKLISVLLDKVQDKDTVIMLNALAQKLKNESN